MKKRVRLVLLIGIVLIPLLPGCVTDDAANRQPPTDADADTYLNPPEESDNSQDEMNRINREWLDESQKSHLNRHP